MRKNDDFRSSGVPFLSNFASQMCPGASMWPRGGPKSENEWILSSLLAPWGTMFEYFFSSGTRKQRIFRGMGLLIEIDVV